MAPAAAPSSSFVPSHCEAPSFEGFEGNGANGANGAWQAPPTTNSERACRDPGRNWAQSFPWDASVNAALPKFGVPAFRPQQREAINACLAGKDVFVRMPTGGGKSLVYQIPAVVKPLVVVISPLLSLIQDQVQELIQLGIGASAVRSRSDDSGEDVRTVTQRMLTGQLQIVYVTPEMIHQSGAFQKALRSLYAEGGLQRFVIDEVHCLSIWGNEFRDSYLQLKNLKASFPSVPILVCSATATEEIIQNVLTQLNMAQDTIFLSPVDRPNLEFKVLPKSKRSIMKEIGELIHTRFRGESGIIYCLSKQNCEDVQQELSRMQIRAEVYHAQVAAHQRAAVQQRWKAGETPIIVATIAFGMGVNKRDVRFVIHHSFPKSLEGYYQEAGRAGRDGRPATSIIFYDYEDKKRHQNMALSDMNQAPEHTERSLQRLLQMVAYCEENFQCRRAFIINYFDETRRVQHVTQQRCQPPAAICDICQAMAARSSGSSGSTAELQQIDVVYEAQLAVQLLRAARQHLVREKGDAPVTLHSVKDALLGSKAQRMASWQNLPGFGGLHGWTEADVLRLLRKLIVKSILAEEITTPGGAAGCVTVAYLIEGRYSESIIYGEIPVQLCLEGKMQKPQKPQPKSGVKRKLQSPNAETCNETPRNRNRRLSKTQIRAAQQRQLQRERPCREQVESTMQQSQYLNGIPSSHQSFEQTQYQQSQHLPAGMAFGHSQQQNFVRSQQQPPAGMAYGQPQQQNFVQPQQQSPPGMGYAQPQQQFFPQSQQEPSMGYGQAQQQNFVQSQQQPPAGMAYGQPQQQNFVQPQQQSPPGMGYAQPQQQFFPQSQQEPSMGYGQAQQQNFVQSQQQPPAGMAYGQPQQQNFVQPQQQSPPGMGYAQPQQQFFPQSQQEPSMGYGQAQQQNFVQSQQQPPAGMAYGQPQQQNFVPQQQPQPARAKHGIWTAAAAELLCLSSNDSSKSQAWDMDSRSSRTVCLSNNHSSKPTWDRHPQQQNFFLSNNHSSKSQAWIWTAQQQNFVPQQARAKHSSKSNKHGIWTAAAAELCASATTTAARAKHGIWTAAAAELCASATTTAARAKHGIWTAAAAELCAFSATATGWHGMWTTTEAELCAASARTTGWHGMWTAAAAELCAASATTLCSLSNKRLLR
ncbi:unnamed protein product [Cladocopium goreaui]|uniref:DNA 3'-5' helicase n=1 Tax=Cladocopium goreaui TaxID=2562237 RepID=A0A9P1D3J6_9DINO|nr:unnamed protein product [Cladocopium goreaui]